MLGGILFGYVMYDVTHYYLHHGQPKEPTFKHLKVKSFPYKNKKNLFGREIDWRSKGNPRETKGIELSKREERKAKGGLRIERGFGYGFRLLPRYEMATQQLHGFGGLFFFFYFILVISPPLYLFLEIFFF